MRPDTPSRLPSFAYVGLHRYFLTICTAARAPVFTSSETVTAAAARLRAATVRHGFSVTVYCFMPDHLHALLVATRDDAALRPCVRHFKQTSSFDRIRASGHRLWQSGYHEHVLRSDEVTLVVARYILENPVRSGLTLGFQDYPFSGSFEFTREQLVDLWTERT